MADKSNSIQALVADARRTQILDAATEVFAAKGFHGATIRQVAQKAGIADGTIYLYFENKTELLLGILDRVNETEQRAQDLGALLDQDIRAFFTTYLRHRLEIVNANFAGLQAILPDLISNAELRAGYMRQIVEPSFAIAESLFAQQIQAGRIKPLDATLVTHSITGLIFGTLVLRMLGDRTFEQRWSELPELFATMILDGISQEPNHEHNHPQPKRKTRVTKTRRHHKS